VNAESFHGGQSHNHACRRLNMHRPSPQGIAQQRPTCPGLVGSSLAEVARARRHSACTIQSERSRHLPWREPKRSDGVEQARHGLRGRRSSQHRGRLGRQQHFWDKPKSIWTDSASAPFAFALFLLRIQQLPRSGRCFDLIFI
jgi:hypothetical protein